MPFPQRCRQRHNKLQSFHHRLVQHMGKLRLAHHRPVHRILQELIDKVVYGTDECELALDLVQPSEKELSIAKVVLDVAEDRFNNLLAKEIVGLGLGSIHLVSMLLP